jgi:hypothetical protein
MNAPALPIRERDAVDALVTDRYLDTLMAAGDRRADDGPADARIDPGTREAARVLRGSLVRVHPSFRFEERLAARLVELANPAHAVGSAAAPGHQPDPLLDAILHGRLDPSDATAVARADGGPLMHRPLIVGGAITSAAISIVGVVWVAWRAAHPSDRAMTRAIRAVARTRRRTAVSLPGGGLGGPA